MTNSTKIIIAVVVVAAVALGAIALSGRDTDRAAINTTENSTTPTESEQATPAAATITYGDNGFSPSLLTVKSGDTIEFVNNSDAAIEPASGPHPVHTDNPQLNVGDIEPRQSKTVTLTTKGTWSYHNHYNEDVRGEITVE